MNKPDVWDVDRIAAAELRAVLLHAPDNDWTEAAAQVFARHRQRSAEWAAARVHDAMIHHLEDRSAREFDRRGEPWADGFRYAEQCVMALRPGELLGTEAPVVRSKGQILRTLVRTATAQVAGTGPQRRG